MANRTLKRSKLEELMALRESKKTRLHSYQVKEEQQIYDTVDDDQYKKILRDRLDEDDFVVDDNGEGYADNGLDDWSTRDPRSDHYESESEEGASRDKGSRKGERKSKSSITDQTGSLNKYFSGIVGQTTAKAKVASTAEDKAFMDSLLDELEDSAPHIPSASRKSKNIPIQSERNKRLRALSPPSTKSNNRDKSQIRSTAVLKQEQRSSPPRFHVEEAGNDQHNDVVMFDASMDDLDTISTSNKRETKSLPNSDDEEELDVKPIHGLQMDVENINLSASRISQIASNHVSKETTNGVKNETVDSSAWKAITANLNVQHGSTASVPYGSLDPSEYLEDDGSLRFFWMDYTEVNGSLCLFGKIKLKKTKRYFSAFLKIDGIMRKLFFLPREVRKRNQMDTDEEVNMSDVYQEVGELMALHNVDEWKGKSCSRKYAFELPDIPKESDYLKVLYPYTKPALSFEVSERGQTFSHVFGLNTALFEQFVLARNIMGPCWLKIEEPNFATVKNASWCKVEAQIDKPSLISRVPDNENLESPLLTLMSIALRTRLNRKDNKQEIIAITGRIYENVDLTDTTSPEKLPCQSFTIIRPQVQMFPPGFQQEAERSTSSIKMEKSESTLLASFLAKLQICDPDALLGHQLDDVVYSILLSRLRECKILNWHRIGRLRRTQWPNILGRGGYFVERQLVTGRLMCDLANDLGKSLMNKCQSWSLTEMCALILGEKRIEMDNEVVLNTWANTARGLLDYLHHCEADTFFIAAIAIKVQMLPLGKQLTNLAGNSWARTMSGTRAERNEYILLHEFTRNKYICPDKTFNKGKGNASRPTDEDMEGDENPTEGKKKDKFKGGLVLEPERGLYDKFILVMDFNSLYPSIIQEFNICFTTVERSDLDEETVPDVPGDAEQGILPKLISTLVQRRRQVKLLMKDKSATTAELAQWDIKQQALKLTANSMYGCLGYTLSRFYARPLAMLTTFKGRETLTATKNLAESMQLRVIYGDTDSVMINTNVDNYMDAFKIGTEFKKCVNDQYRLLEIDIDNVFQRLLLHSKKKYAALNYAADGRTIMEVKGLDMRRREYCQLSKDMSGAILKEILSGDETDVVVERIHDYLRITSERIRNGEFQSNKFIIYTKLSKDPEAYPGGRTMPQVQVALRRKSKGDIVRSNDVIAYIVTGDSGSSINPAERAYSPQELKADPDLKPDAEWYLVKQIFPPIERLCGPIDGTDAMRLAECLGLDTRKYQIAQTYNAAEKEIHPLESTMSDEDRFQTASSLQLRCCYCKESLIIDNLGAIATPEGIQCKNAECSKPFSPITINAQIETEIRYYVNKYYESWLRCDDTSCGNRTRQMSVYGKRCLGPLGTASGCLGVMSYEYTDKMLYNQLLYFQSLFNVEKAKKNSPSDSRDKISVLLEQNRSTIDVVNQTISSYLKKCGRQWVQMDNIFSFVV